MGIASNLQPDNRTTKPSTPLNQLSLRELEVLLSLIKTSTFTGGDIEPLYNMVNKLQNQYLEQKK